MWIDESEGAIQLHRFGYGHSLTERLAFEAYSIFKKRSGDSTSLEAYELERRYQLSEQGEYDTDWRVITELERNHELDVWEISSG